VANFLTTTRSLVKLLKDLFFSRMSAAAKIASSGLAVGSGTEGGGATGETAIKGRRGTLYHLSSIVEEQQKEGTTTLSDVKIRRRFATSRYFLSLAGILKLLVIVSACIRTLFLSHFARRDENETHCNYFISVAFLSSLDFT